MLNGKVLIKDFEGDLSQINEKKFVSLKVIGKDQLMSDYGVAPKEYGIIIKADSIVTRGIAPTSVYSKPAHPH